MIKTNIEERKEKYGCNGMCYGGIDDDGQHIHMCGGVDTCEETRIKEAFATFLAIWIVMVTPMVFVLFIILINCLKY